MSILVTVLAGRYGADRFLRLRMSRALTGVSGQIGTPKKLDGQRRGAALKPWEQPTPDSLDRKHARPIPAAARKLPAKLTRARG